MNIWKPSKADLQAAARKTVPDVIAPGLKILFVGINPGLYSGAVGHHFARPGNRFWPALAAAGFTDRVLSPFEERRLLDLGYGITNLVRRVTATANELSTEELLAGKRRVEVKTKRYRPPVLAVLGVEAYRQAFQRPKGSLGLQKERLAGAKVWVLPNPSGLNAHYQLPDLARLFAELKQDSESKT
jgi:TDG/mug DNA glycosylase family protein